MTNQFLTIGHPRGNLRASFAKSVMCVMGIAVLQVGPGVVLASETHPDDQKAVLQHSKSLISRTGAWQSYGDVLHIKSGLERSMQLEFTNGADGRPALTDMQVEMSRKPFITLKDFNGKSTYTCDLAGKVAVGNTPITVKVFGPSGARMSWQLLVDKPVVSEVKPHGIGNNDEVTVVGKNFTTNTRDLHVYVGGKSLKISQASETEIKAKSQGHLPGGTQDLVVAVYTVKSSPFPVNVKSNPQLTRLSHLSTPPGQPLVITGSGFSSNPSENVVEFRHHKAKVTGATETSITCVVPEMHFPDWHVPVTVTTNGVKSKNRLEINVDMRVIENEGVPIP